MTYQLLKIYVGESDQAPDGSPLYEKIIFLAKENGLKGATAYRGIMGFGSNSYVHSSKILRLSEDLPIIIDILDEANKISSFIKIIRDYFQEGSIAVIDLANFLHCPMTVREIMSSPPIAVQVKDTLIKVLELISEHKIKFIPVVSEENKLEGIITGRNILQAFSLDLKTKNHSLFQAMSKDKKDLPVNLIMNKEVITVSPELKVVECAKLLNKHKVKRFPVVDAENRLLGVISRTDILYAWKSVDVFLPEEETPFGKVAKDLAYKDVPVIQENTPLTQVAELVLEHYLQMAVCVNEQNQVIGLIFDSDLIQYVLQQQDVSVLKKVKEFFGQHKEVSLRNLLHTSFYYLKPEDDLQTIIKTMQKYNVKRLPVLTEDRRLLGVVERDSLLPLLI